MKSSCLLLGPLVASGRLKRPLVASGRSQTPKVSSKVVIVFTVLCLLIEVAEDGYGSIPLYQLLFHLSLSPTTVIILSIYTFYNCKEYKEIYPSILEPIEPLFRTGRDERRLETFLEPIEPLFRTGKDERGLEDPIESSYAFQEPIEHLFRSVS